MMAEYFTRGASISSSNEDLSVTADTVFMDDDGPKDTGLVDAAGQKIYRASNRAPLGFRMGRK